jgi:hypothetical protein
MGKVSNGLSNGPGHLPPLTGYETITILENTMACSFYYVGVKPLRPALPHVLPLSNTSLPGLMSCS